MCDSLKWLCFSYMNVKILLSSSSNTSLVLSTIQHGSSHVFMNSFINILSCLPPVSLFSKSSVLWIVPISYVSWGPQHNDMPMYSSHWRSSHCPTRLLFQGWFISTLAETCSSFQTHVCCYGHNLGYCSWQTTHYLPPCFCYLENDYLAQPFFNQLAYSSYLPKQYIFSSASESNFYSGGIWLCPQRCTLYNIFMRIICPCMSQWKKVSWNLNVVLCDCNSSSWVVDQKIKYKNRKLKGSLCCIGFKINNILEVA